MSTSMIPELGSLSFWRVVDVPFETCVAAFDSWLPTMSGGELRIGGSQLLGPIEHDREFPGAAGADGMSTNLVTAPGSLSFWRIADVPFGTCIAALDSWLRAGHGGELRFGGSQVLGPMEHDHDLGTRRIQVRLARGPLYPPLRMRLEIDRWSSSSTALELIPDRLVRRLVRPTADYFRAGRLLLDSLARSLPQRPEASVTSSIAS